MTAHQATLFENARRVLATARLTLDAGDARAAVNRAYYAAFYAATAALLSKGEAPKSHKGMHRRFHMHFVASGSLDAAIGGTLSFAGDARQQADYDAFTVFDEAAAADLKETGDAWTHPVHPVPVFPIPYRHGGEPSSIDASVNA